MVLVAHMLPSGMLAAEISRTTVALESRTSVAGGVAVVLACSPASRELLATRTAFK